MTSTLVVGGSGGPGSVIARHIADRGDDVVIKTLAVEIAPHRSRRPAPCRRTDSRS